MNTVLFLYIFLGRVVVAKSGRVDKWGVNWYEASFGDDGHVLKLDSGDGCTILGLY